MEENFYALYQERGQQKYGIRLLAMHHLQIGKTLKVVSEIVCKTIRTIRLWVKRYAIGGIQGLLSIKKGRGRRCKVTLEQQKELKTFLQEQATRKKGGRLTGINIQEFLKKEWEVSYTLSGVYLLLEKIGFSWITSRSVHPKADMALQEAFKK